MRRISKVRASFSARRLSPRSFSFAARFARCPTNPSVVSCSTFAPVTFSSQRLTRSKSGDHANSPLAISSRSSKFASDIFSLGCLFQFVLVPGSHPFGAFYERENNILRGKPSELDRLMAVDPLAYDLVKSMVDDDYKRRPTAKEVLKHPMFWPATKRLGFLCDLSDQLEVEGAVSSLALKVRVCEERKTSLMHAVLTS